ncbi:hypothetical protein HD806DRAFT_485539 [Xylariaceae sp. AK1471]|nr:hypothetical protein HD806DRAFT_485539 [Xylariaceae sp. AK1471]
MTAPPTQNSTVTSATSNESETGIGSGSTSIPSNFTKTETLGGITPTFTGPLTSLSPTSSPGAAATPVKLGAGVLAGILGAVVLL